MDLNSEAFASLTPMLRQYFELKQHADGAVLFFRMGDFYEIFGDDAAEIAPKMDVVLTSREKGDQTRIPFCGVPHHSAKTYWLKLLQQGYKVAIVEQLEDPQAAKGLVKRGIVRTYSPGSIDELEGLNALTPNYLLAHIEVPGSRENVVVVADVSTGELRVGTVSALELVSVIRGFAPREILARRFAVTHLKEQLADLMCDDPIHIGVLPEAALKDENSQKELMSRFFGNADLATQPSGDVRGGRALIASVVSYIESLGASISQFTRVLPLRDSGTMLLSDTVIRDLELFETARRREVSGSLAHVIDRTLSPMGARALRYAIAHPFANLDSISQRHDSVEQLVGEGEEFLVGIRSELKDAADIARLATRILSGNISPHELAMVRTTVSRAEVIAPRLRRFVGTKSVLGSLAMSLEAAKDAREIIDSALVPEPIGLGAGRGVFKTGYDHLLDEKIQWTESGESKVAAYEERLRKDTGISSLKIKEHKSFGLLVEVTKANIGKVPSTFIRRQTMTNGDRFSTMELKELSDAVSLASEQATQREQELFRALIEKLSVHRDSLVGVATSIAELDVLQSFAWLAVKECYTRPKISADGRHICVKAGRHPVVEKFVGRHKFTANDVLFEVGQPHLLITGPNMAGKSTVMRQLAVIAILAQAGSFVPAQSAELPLFDRVFTRVGASDDLSRGQSTFMVEMTEAAEILRQASSKSLVILDEVGRGTSTTDGLAIATAILEDLVGRVGCFTMFATHYHELVPAMAHRKDVRAVQTEVIEKDNREIVFTHRLVDGASGSSYGIEVARLAGVPQRVIDIARQHLTKSELKEGVETSSQVKADLTQKLGEEVRKGAIATVEAADERPSRVQRDLFGLGASTSVVSSQKDPLDLVGRISGRLESVRIHRTTPLQALNILNELKQMLVPLAQKGLFDEDHNAQV